MCIKICLVISLVWLYYASVFSAFSYRISSSDRLNRSALCVDLKKRAEVDLPKGAKGFEKELCPGIRLKERIKQRKFAVAIMPWGERKKFWFEVFRAYENLDIAALEQLQHAKIGDDYVQLDIVLLIVSAFDRRQSLYEKHMSQSAFIALPNKTSRTLLSPKSRLLHKSLR
jgi:hypothetical protein